MHHDVTSISNKVEYLEKGVTKILPKRLHCHFKRSLQSNMQKKNSNKISLHRHFNNSYTYPILYSQAAAIILAVLSYTMALNFNNQPQITLKAEKNKAFNGSCLFSTFNIKSGKIADCLEHCLENCRCQSFQICHETECQLCSSHKEENSSLLHDEDGCVYATYEIRQSTKTFQVILRYFVVFFMYHATFPNMLSLTITMKQCCNLKCSFTVKTSWL